MKADRAYLEKISDRLRSQHLNTAFQLALGDPAKEIVKIAEQEHCDLIAMASHGHRLIGDLLFGSTTHQVRHATAIPVLIVRREKQ
jgi:manganese transport protein